MDGIVISNVMSIYQRRKCYSTFEKELLLELVKDKINIIEMKETDKVTVQQKLRAWKEVEKRFNSTRGVVERTSKQLIQCYKRNLRKRALKKTRNNDSVSLSQEANRNNMYESSVSMTADPVRNEFSSGTRCNIQTDNGELQLNSSEIQLNCLGDSNTSSCDFKQVTSGEEANSSSSSCNTERYSTPTLNLILQQAEEKSTLSLVNKPYSRFARLQSHKHQMPTNSQTSETIKAIAEQSKAKQEAIEEEHKMAILHMEEEHSIKMQILSTQLLFHQKLLNILDTNPSALHLHISNE